MRKAPSYYPVAEIEDTEETTRLARIQFFSAEKLRQVIAWPGSQKRVRERAQRLLDRIERGKGCRKG